MPLIILPLDFLASHLIVCLASIIAALAFFNLDVIIKSIKDFCKKI